ncbi:MAG: Mrp/NBP35 family ATP-binding protein [Planctomycetota bacterium]
MTPPGSTDVTSEQVLGALRAIQDPDLGKDIVTLDFVKDLAIQNGKVSFRIELTTPACPVKEQFRTQAEELVGTLPGVASVSVKMGATVAANNPLLASNKVEGIKNILAVSSGKGGVGKSTVAVNLSIALAQTGASVGILDADVYGPNVPIMLGLSGKPAIRGQKIQPFEAHGTRVMSMGFLVQDDQPVIWRGPMLHGAIRQFLFDVEWGEIDYLVVDLPPGTGDAQLSLAQQSQLMGSVVVTTPQDVSVLDVRRAIGMFKQVNVPVLGIIENMSGLLLSGRVGGDTLELDGVDKRITVNQDGSFQAELPVFGNGGGDKIAREFEIPLLGRIPLDPRVRSGGDEGRPVTVAAPASTVSSRFRDIAGQLAARVSTVNLS